MLTGWKYRKAITVTNAVASYPTKVLVGESSGATGEDVDCGAKCLTTFNDLRFTGANGTTLLPYWIESITGTTPNQLATVWVKNDATPSTTLYMYYGHAGATSLSSGTDTFSFFDDFPGTSYNATTWPTLVGTAPTVASSILTCNDPDTNYSAIVSSATFGQNYALRSRFKNKHLSYWYTEAVAMSDAGNNGLAARPDFDEAQDYYTYVGTAENFHGDCSNTVWFSQSFTTVGSMIITGVRLPLFRVGTPGTVTVGIYSVSGGKPNVLLTSGTMDGDTLTTDGAGASYDIGVTAYTLSATTQYCIVLHSAASQCSWMGNSAGSFAGGDACLSSDTGATWTEYSAIDQKFTVSGVASHYSIQKAAAKTIAPMTGWTVDTYHTIDMIRNGNTNGIYKVDDANTVTIATNVSDENCPIVLVARKGAGMTENAEIDVDWVLVRPYTATEPSFAYGAETVIPQGGLGRLLAGGLL
jgi:hypothetical protein